MRSQVCEVVQDLLPLYAENECSKGSKDYVESHLTECESCSIFFRQLMKTDELQMEDMEKGAEAEDIEKEKKILRRGFLKVMFRVLGILLAIGTVIIYIGCFVTFFQVNYSGAKDSLYPHIASAETVTVWALMYVICPIIGMILLFVFRGKKWKNIVRICIQIILLVYIPIEFLCGTFTSVVVSHTTDPANYFVFDSSVMGDLDLRSYAGILPEEIPEGVENVTYSYEYYDLLGPVYGIEVSWQYPDVESYQDAVREFLDENEFLGMGSVRGEGERVYGMSLSNHKSYYYVTNAPQRRVTIFVGKWKEFDD